MQTHLITLTTDFGTTDGSINLLKLQIQKALPTAAFNDLSHQVKPLHIAHAAYLASNLYPHFAAGTLHLILANGLHEKNCELLFAKFKEHYFLSLNNGIFSFKFENENVQ